MDFRPPNFEGLQDRLLKLEKQNRRFKQLGIAALIVPALLLVMGQAASKKTVEANEFILRDDSGNIRAKLEMVGTLPVPEMTLFDDKGNASVRMNGGINENLGAGISLFDSRGQERESFRVLQDGPALTLEDSKGKNRGIFGFSEPRNNTLLAVFDMDGNPRGQFAGGNNGAALELYDSKQALRGIFTGGENGAGLVLVDAKGSVQTGLTGGSIEVFDDQGFEATLGIKDLGNSHTGETHKTSAASVVLLDKNNNVIWKAP
jgi:hypothetical protein